MENKKKYKSTSEYSKKYNKSNINIQLDRDLISRFRKNIDGKPIKSTIENLILEYLNERLK